MVWCFNWRPAQDVAPHQRNGQADHQQRSKEVGDPFEPEEKGAFQNNGVQPRQFVKQVVFDGHDGGGSQENGKGPPDQQVHHAGQRVPAQDGPVGCDGHRGAADPGGKFRSGPGNRRGRQDPPQVPVDAPGEGTHGQGGKHVEKHFIRRRNVPEDLTRGHEMAPFPTRRERAGASPAMARRRSGHFAWHSFFKSREATLNDLW
jgi:hypothetical protein